MIDLSLTTNFIKHSRFRSVSKIFRSPSKVCFETKTHFLGHPIPHWVVHLFLFRRGNLGSIAPSKSAFQLFRLVHCNLSAFIRFPIITDHLEHVLQVSEQCITDRRTDWWTDGPTEGQNDQRTEKASYTDARTYLKTHNWPSDEVMDWKILHFSWPWLLIVFIAHFVWTMRSISFEVFAAIGLFGNQLK